MSSLFEEISNIHRYLSRQLLYPILLSTLLAVSLYAARVFFSRAFAYDNLVWNLYLAWLPYVFALTAGLLNFMLPRSWWLLIVPGILWLAFFPNAPYILTDFLHLEDRPSIPLWYDILLLASFAWTGCFLAVASLRTMQILIKEYLGLIASWLFVAVALALGGLGIYLGRFSRWNSWDLVFQPREVLFEVASRIVNPLSNLQFYGFTFLFTAFLLVMYLTFISFRQLSEP
ncbi:MAG TPA: DUF1361 domain-containing protein [Anaerolineales bacterium]|nr:DUF1361 domain-containing protein [Anaerolineales bacterium]